MMNLKEDNTDVKLLKADSYQKDLLDFTLLATERSPTKRHSSPTPQNRNNLVNSANSTRKNMRQMVNILSKINDRSQLAFEYVGKKVSVMINRANLLEQKVEIIVNAANTELLFGGRHIEY